MVSIEQIQKANTLSKELKKHGFASDFGEAFTQAEAIFDRAQLSPEVAFSTKDATPQMTVVDENYDELQSRLRQLERYKSFAEQREAQYKEQLVALHEKFENVLKSVKLLEMNQQGFSSQLSSMKTNPVPAKEESPQVEAAPAASSTPIDRTGIAPADVSVEKIFYSGSN